jgi:hypothetical protein
MKLLLRANGTFPKEHETAPKELLWRQDTVELNHCEDRTAPEGIENSSNGRMYFPLRKDGCTPLEAWSCFAMRKELLQKGDIITPEGGWCYSRRRMELLQTEDVVPSLFQTKDLTAA